MRSVRALVALTAVVGFIGCTVQSAPEGVGSTEQAITGTCTINQLGAPCDPDGTGGPLQECEGICALTTGGPLGVQPQCRAITALGIPNMDGRICGSSGNGVGNCGQVCQGKLCVAKAAADGTACRPSNAFDSTLCDGECKSGTCTAITTGKCAVEKLTAGGFNQDCVWNWCAPTAARTCENFAMPKGQNCNDGSACTTGDTCDGTGKCTGTAKTCPSSGNPCLVNACVSSSGACVASPSPGTACTLADKCFAGVCDSTGACAKGTAVSCDDGDACTVDACDATTGCSHAAKSCPPPSDACTVATCDKTSGACGFVAKSCDDGNPCTTDSCSASTGCVHAPISGCSFDAGPADTGVPPTDTGVIPADTGVPPTDSSVGPTDTGFPVMDSGFPVDDTGPEPFDGDIVDSFDVDDAGSTDSGSSATDGGEAGLEVTDDLSRGGCGCRTSGDRSSTGAFALGALALAIVTRRRR